MIEAMNAEIRSRSPEYDAGNREEWKRQMRQVLGSGSDDIREKYMTRVPEGGWRLRRE